MNKFLNAAILIAFGLLVGALIWLTAAPPRGVPITLRPAPTPRPLQVHVAGAVARPGVYEMPPEARLQDALEAAGGLVQEADPAALNLAERLSDGVQVLVPFLPTPQPTQSSSSGSGAPPSGPGVDGGGRININTATQTQLETLPGIGPATAQKIIAYRQENGPFELVADIVNVSGIGPSTYDKIKDNITVADPP